MYKRQDEKDGNYYSDENDDNNNRKSDLKATQNKNPYYMFKGSDKKLTFKGKTLSESKRLLTDTRLLENAGVFSIVLECVETKLSKKISNHIKIPTIGIGSSVNCDGQVLVVDDLIGLSQSKLKFVKKFVDITKLIELGVIKFKSEVLKKQFPKAKHSFLK